MPRRVKPYEAELKLMSMEERGAMAKILEEVIIRYMKLSNYLDEKGYEELSNFVYGDMVKTVTKTKNLFEGVRSVIPKDRSESIYRANALKDYMQKGKMQQKLRKINRVVKKINNQEVA